MKLPKNFFVVVVAVLVATGLFLFSLLFLQHKTQPGAPATTPAGPTMSISTQNGSVTVQDITKNPLQELPDNTVIAKTGQYSIVYFPKEQTFSIALLSLPLQQARDAAEEDLLKRLGIGFGQACKLSVVVSVPYSVDSAAAGTDYGLSFCIDSQQLPQ